MKNSIERGNKKLKFLDRNIGVLLIFFFRLLKIRHQKCPKRNEIKNAAFLKTAAIGDTVLTSAIVKDFKKNFPDVKLTFFTGTDNNEIAGLLSV